MTVAPGSGFRRRVLGDHARDRTVWRDPDTPHGTVTATGGAAAAYRWA